MPGNAEFGSARAFVRFDATDPDATAAALAEARRALRRRSTSSGRPSCRCPARPNPVELRALQPGGPFSGAAAGLCGTGATRSVRTRSPSPTARPRAAPGGTVTVDGRVRRVVGSVENPSDLGAEFALVASGPEVAAGLGHRPGRRRSTRCSAPSGPPAPRRPGVPCRRGRPTRGSWPRSASSASWPWRCCWWASWRPPACWPWPSGASGSSACSPPSAPRPASCAWSRWPPAGSSGVLAAVGRHRCRARRMGGRGTPAGGPLGPYAAIARATGWSIPWVVVGAAMVLTVLSTFGAAWWPARTAAGLPIVRRPVGQARAAPARPPLGRARPWCWWRSGLVVFGAVNRRPPTVSASTSGDAVLIIVGHGRHRARCPAPQPAGRIRSGPAGRPSPPGPAPGHPRPRPPPGPLGGGAGRRGPGPRCAGDRGADRGGGRCTPKAPATSPTEQLLVTVAGPGGSVHPHGRRGGRAGPRAAAARRGRRNRRRAPGTIVVPGLVTVPAGPARESLDDLRSGSAWRPPERRRLALRRPALPGHAGPAGPSRPRTLDARGSRVRDQPEPAGDLHLMAAKPPGAGHQAAGSGAPDRRPGGRAWATPTCPSSLVAPRRPGPGAGGRPVRAAG